MMPFILLAPFPLIFVWCVARIVARRRRLSWPVVFGKVIDYQFRPGTRASTQYVLRYSYEAAGTPFETTEAVPPSYPVRSHILTRRADRLNAGDEVEVFISPNNPERATIAPSGWETGTGPLLLISGIATIALLILSIRAL